MQKPKATTTEIAPISDDDEDDTERCPLCKTKECRTHLLARFDEFGDEGEFGVGIVGGPFFYLKEIKEVLDRVRLAWVQSAQAPGKPKAPRWIIKEQGLQDYYDVLGGAGGFDLEI